jgi:hypothetical protein
VLTSQPDSERIAAYLWLATVGTLGTWAVLVPAKFFEGKLEDQVPMRMTLLGLGVLVGIAAWVLGEALLLKSPGWNEPLNVNEGLITNELLGWPRASAESNPNLAYYIAYFAFLMLLPRWWRQTEYTRNTRMSVWCVVGCVGVAWLLHMFWWFPQPLGMMAAGIMALSIQLASPWMPPSRRRALSENIEHAVV